MGGTRAAFLRLPRVAVALSVAGELEFELGIMLGAEYGEGI